MKITWLRDIVKKSKTKSTNYFNGRGEADPEFPSALECMLCSAARCYLISLGAIILKVMVQINVSGPGWCCLVD